MNILMIYGSQEGQTEKITKTIANVLVDRGHSVEFATGENSTSTLAPDLFGAVIVGASIHNGKYPAFIKRFASEHKGILNEKPSAFFSVCMSVRSRDEDIRRQARQYVDDFFKVTGWKPPIYQSFAGAIRYTEYGFVTRWIMKRIAAKEGLDTDTSRDYEYTDWNAVSQFVSDFLITLK